MFPNFCLSGLKERQVLNQHSWEMNKLLQPNQEGKHNLFSPQEVTKAGFVLQNIMRGVFVIS